VVSSVRVQGKNQRELVLYFDQRTALLIKSEHRIDGLGGKDVLQEAFYSAYRDVGGHRIVALANIPRPTPACRVVYVSGASLGDASRAIAGLQGSPVLTISDAGGFTDAGGIAQFLFERGRLRFTIKAEAVQRSGLKMSSKLLILGQR
jgi:hypothetical protein